MAILGKAVAPVARTPVKGPADLNIKTQRLRSPVVNNSAITKHGYMEAAPSAVKGMEELTRAQLESLK